MGALGSLGLGLGALSMPGMCTSTVNGSLVSRLKKTPFGQGEGTRESLEAPPTRAKHISQGGVLQHTVY
jgi:hypothetical protein